MPTLRTHGRRASAVVALASSALLIGAGLAHADNVQNAVAASGIGIGGSTTITSGGSVDIKYYIDASSNGPACEASDGTPVTVTIVTPAEVTATPSSLLFNSCGSVSTNFQTVTFTSSTLSAAGGWNIGTGASDAADSYNASPANFHLKVVAPGTTDPCTTGADADADGISDACDTNSYAPVVGVQAPDADGNEGTPGNPVTAGSFTDPDGNSSLTLSVTAGDDPRATFTDNGDGTFDWSILTTDDAAGDVTVSATDGEHAAATQTFHWVAANVAPVVGEITATPTGPCTVGISAPFADQGTGDTHTASISWGDTTSTSVGAVVQPGPVAGSHSYTTNGIYTIGVTVTDDDGGVGTNSLGDAFATKNVASNFLEPVNINGQPRSVFKLGSTIPLKIKVTGCDGLAVTGLSPTISSIKVDSSAGDLVNETTISTASPTPGITMRWADTQYIYNFSTKNSVLSNLPSTLTAGTYTVKASDPSFYAPVTATFDLKK